MERRLAYRRRQSRLYRTRDMNGNGLLTWVRGVGILLLAGFIGWSALTTQSNAVALGRVIEKQNIMHDLLRTSVLRSEFDRLEKDVKYNTQRIRDLP